MADFGFAKAASSGRSVLGTIGYAAPEVFDSGTYTLLADIYSFGSVVQMLLLADFLPMLHLDQITSQLIQVNAASTVQFLLLTKADSPERRPTAEALKRNPFFEDIDWTQLRAACEMNRRFPQHEGEHPKADEEIYGMQGIMVA